MLDKMNRREFMAMGAVIPTMAMAENYDKVKIGIDLFSLRAQKWSALEALDYCAARKVQVVHFSEIRFLGNLEPDHLRKVRAKAAELGLEVEIGMKSICPTSTMFDKKDGTAEEQLGRMIDAADTVGSKIVRCVLGSGEDRVKPGPIEARIADTAQVLKNVRSKAVGKNIKIAIENHAGDMQARELKMLVEEGGRDFVGVCLDSGNPLWTIEDPHLTLGRAAPLCFDKPCARQCGLASAARGGGDLGGDGPRQR